MPRSEGEKTEPRMQESFSMLVFLEINIFEIGIDVKQKEI